jgi:hypothetical protein
MYNPSTLALLSRAESWQSRLPLLHRSTALWCKSHQRIERVTDYFAGSDQDCRLACGCRRRLHDPAVIAEYEAEKLKRGHQRRTGWMGTGQLTIEEAA